MAEEPSEVEVLVAELETRVERLRALYEMYFMGIEKTEPTVPRKDVDRRLYVLRKAQLRNTALRFRFQNVLLRYNSYQTYWTRIARQIEEGTYKRDIRRAKSRFDTSARGKVEREMELADDDLVEVEDERPPPPSRKPIPDAPVSLSDDDVSLVLDDIEDDRADLLERLQLGALVGPSVGPTITAKRAAPVAPAREPPVPRAGVRYAQAAPVLRGAGDGSVAPRPSPVARTPPPQPASAPAPVRALAAPVQAPASSLSEERVRQIYTKYVETKRSLKESTASLTFDGLAKSLRESSDKLRAKHAGKSVDFEVTVKDGRTILRPVVK